MLTHHPLANGAEQRAAASADVNERKFIVRS